MDRLLSKISAPLLVGSILALGAMAFQAHAADGSQYVFRTKNTGVVLTSAAVPENDAESAETEEPEGTPFVRFSYGEGWVLGCETDWPKAKFEQFRDLLDTRFEYERTDFKGVFLARGTVITSETPSDKAFFGSHSLLTSWIHKDGHVSFVPWAKHPGDPREWPPEASHDHPTPCLADGETFASFGEPSDITHHVELQTVELVYR